VLCSVPSPSGCLRATSEFLFLGARGAAADESGGGSAVRCRPMTTIEQAVCTSVRNLRACTRVSLRPIPQWAALEGCTAVALMADHDDTRQPSRQCARACGTLTRVRRACLWRAQQAVPTSTDPMGKLSRTREFKVPGAGKEDTVECGAAAILESEGPAPVSVGRQHARSSRAAMHCQ